MAEYNKFGAGKLFEPHGTSGMYLIGRYADLGAKTELIAVIKASRGVYKNSGRIDLS
jgi:hypothetical protein